MTDSETLHDWIEEKREYWREQAGQGRDEARGYLSLLDDLESDLLQDGLIEETREVRCRNFSH